MKLSKQWVEAEKKRLSLYKELGIEPPDDPIWLEYMQGEPTNTGFSIEREENEPQ